MSDAREYRPPMHPAPVYLLGAVIDAICSYDAEAQKSGRPKFPLDAISVVRDAFRRETEEYYRRMDNAR